MFKILLAGASGRLGKEMTASIRDRRLALEPINRSEISQISAKFANKSDACIVVDVTLPEGTEKLVASLLESGVPTRLKAVVIGSTGHSPEQIKQIQKLSEKLPIILSTNFSRGVFFVEEMLRARTSSGMSVAELARSLGFDLALWESHHTLKKDAPSGTAKTLAQAAGIPAERISATRVGSVVGEHALFLSQESEEIRITHTAHARRLFAEGALDLCERLFKTNLPAGFYTTAEAYRAILNAGG